MVKNNQLGSKTGQGFYKKEKAGSGNQFFALNLKTLEYKPSQKVSFPIPDIAKKTGQLKERLRILVASEDKAGDFYRATLYQLFAYASNRIPQIADELYKIDIAMTAGFGWELGPFEKWDAIGVEQTVKAMEAKGYKPAQWVHSMLAAGAQSFYKIEGGKRFYYDTASKHYQLVPGAKDFILLDNIRESNLLWKNSGSSIIDIGDGILNLEFRTKMNIINNEVLLGINEAITRAENSCKGLVISNEGTNFSAGADLGLVYALAGEKKFDELNLFLKAFQNTMMRIRYSSVPVVVAPHQLTLGGACEICLHADKVVAHAELYMGLVEFGVGLIPGGGGTKEFALRLADELQEGDIELNNFRARFLTIAQAKTSTSAYEAFELGYLKKGRDVVVISRNRLLAEAKKQCLMMANEGYTPPVPRREIRVLGKQALGLAYAGANAMYSGNYISEYDVKVTQKLAYVLAGGDLSQPSLVSEAYLLNLEREAFISLCAEEKTLERMQSVLNGGKTIKN